MHLLGRFGSGSQSAIELSIPMNILLSGSFGSGSRFPHGIRDRPGCAVHPRSERRSGY